jgi:GntR family transcriptional regulator
MEFSNNLPIYLQIINHIKQDIVVGKLKAGQKMPSVRELAGELKVNPNTIQRAYLELDRENITFTKRGMGTYLNGEEEKIQSLQKEISGKIIQDFIKDMNKLGFSDDKIIGILREYL